MKKFLLAFLIVSSPLMSGCDPKVGDTAVGDLTMLYDPYLGHTGYKEVEIYDSKSQKTVLMPAGRYSTTKVGSEIVIKDQADQRVASIPLKHASLDKDAHTFRLSVQDSKNTLDIYGGKIFRPLASKRYGKPWQNCTISCCTTHEECDSDGKNCHSVCDDCSGHRDELWEDVDFRWDYEIFFGKPGSYEVAVYNAKGQPQKKKTMLEAETCH